MTNQTIRAVKMDNYLSLRICTLINLMVAYIVSSVVWGGFSWPSYPVPYHVPQFIYIVFYLLLEFFTVEHMRRLRI